MSETRATKLEVDATGREFRMEVIDDVTAGILRAMTPAQRMAAVVRFQRGVRDYMIGMLRAMHPDWNEEQIASEMRRRVQHGAG